MGPSIDSWGGNGRSSSGIQDSPGRPGNNPLTSPKGRMRGAVCNPQRVGGGWFDRPRFGQGPPPCPNPQSSRQLVVVARRMPSPPRILERATGKVPATQPSSPHRSVPEKIELPSAGPKSPPTIEFLGPTIEPVRRMEKSGRVDLSAPSSPIQGTRLLAQVMPPASAPRRAGAFGFGKLAEHHQMLIIFPSGKFLPQAMKCPETRAWKRL